MDADFLLIRKMKQGDERAIEMFVRKYYPVILQYCGYRCFDSDYAQDLAQETFAKFLPRCPNIVIRERQKIIYIRLPVICAVIRDGRRRKFR